MSGRSETGVGDIEPKPGYAGDVTADHAWRILQTDPKAVLVDVRTQAEWTYVGVPVLDQLGKQTIFVEWQSFPSMAQNLSFAEQVAATGVAPDSTVLFICRSGARSAAAAAAMTARGYEACYNISDGFEGPHDEQKHRGTTNGWKARGLPWAQG